MWVALVMRHLNVSYQEAKILVHSKRAVASPNLAFRAQLVEWEKCNFDLQNMRTVGETSVLDPWALGFKSKGNGRKVEGEGKAEQKPQEGEKKDVKEDTYAKQDKAGRVNEETGGRSEEDVRNKKNETHDGDGRNMDRKAEESQADKIDQQTQRSSPAPTSEVIPAKDKPDIVKDEGDSGDTDVRSAEEDRRNNNEPPAEHGEEQHDKVGYQMSEDHPQTEKRSHTPTSEVVRAALKPLWLKYPVMGKKKLLRILNENEGWNLGCKEFRAHLEAVIAE